MLTAFVYARAPCGGGEVESKHVLEKSRGIRVPTYGFRQERPCAPETVEPWTLSPWTTQARFPIIVQRQNCSPALKTRMKSSAFSIAKAIAVVWSWMIPGRWCSAESTGRHTAELGGSPGDLVYDRYGHTYRVVSHPGHGFHSGRDAGLWYVEVKVS